MNKYILLLIIVPSSFFAMEMPTTEKKPLLELFITPTRVQLARKDAHIKMCRIFEENETNIDQSKFLVECDIKCGNEPLPWYEGFIPKPIMEYEKKTGKKNLEIMDHFVSPAFFLADLCDLKDGDEFEKTIYGYPSKIRFVGGTIKGQQLSAPKILDRLVAKIDRTNFPSAVKIPEVTTVSENERFVPKRKQIELLQKELTEKIQLYNQSEKLAVNRLEMVNNQVAQINLLKESHNTAITSVNEEITRVKEDNKKLLLNANLVQSTKIDIDVWEQWWSKTKKAFIGTGLVTGSVIIKLLYDNFHRADYSKYFSYIKNMLLRVG